MLNFIFDGLQTLPTLEEVLEELHYGETSQDVSLTNVLEIMDAFPDFEFGEEITLSMTTMFIEKYDIRRIGSDTIPLFMHFWKEKANELLVKYAPKIEKWKENFNDLFKFTVQLGKTVIEGTSRSGTNKYYLNPASANAENLKVQDVDTNNGTGSRNVTETRDVLQSVWGKTRADIMEKILNLKDIFNDCLQEFETIFLGVL